MFQKDMKRLRWVYTRDKTEIKDYSNSHYVSSMKAAYHILGFPMHGDSNSIINVRLEVHMYGKCKQILITFNLFQTESSDIQVQMCEYSKLKAFLNCTEKFSMHKILLTMTFQALLLEQKHHLLG